MFQGGTDKYTVYIRLNQATAAIANLKPYMIENSNVKLSKPALFTRYYSQSEGGGGWRLLPYIGYIGMCRGIWYDF